MCEENNESFNDETDFKRFKQCTFSQQVQSFKKDNKFKNVPNIEIIRMIRKRRKQFGNSKFVILSTLWKVFHPWTYRTIQNSECFSWRHVMSWTSQGNILCKSCMWYVTAFVKNMPKLEWFKKSGNFTNLNSSQQQTDVMRCIYIIQTRVTFTSYHMWCWGFSHTCWSLVVRDAPSLRINENKWSVMISDDSLSFLVLDISFVHQKLRSWNLKS